MSLPEYKCQRCGRWFSHYAKRKYCSRKCYFDPHRIWDFVIKGKSEDDCWGWTQSFDSNGYAAFRNGRERKASRTAWMLTNGEIPEGLCVLHRCDNPKCINPKHLFLGTKKDNANDMMRKGRNVPPCGERCGTSKITKDKVKQIRELYSTGCYSTRDLIPLFNISQAQISRIVRRERWAHIP